MTGESLQTLLAAVSEDASVQAETAAYALVTAHDSDVSELEVGKFVEMMVDEVRGSPAELGHRFATLAQAMKADLPAAADFTRDVLRGVKEDVEVARKVVRAARAAAIADMDLDRREEHALVMIGAALGVDAAL